MKLKSVVTKLISEGADIKYYTRPDGSIRVYEINGVKYNIHGSEGNRAVRGMTGTTLSVAQTSQRAAIRPPSFSPEVNKALRATQRLFREKQKKTVGSRKRETVTAAQVRGRIREVGEKQALEELEQTQRYLKGLVEADRWLAFKTRVIEVMNNAALRDSENASTFNEIVEKIEHVKIDDMTADDFTQIASAFYDLTTVISNYDDIEAVASYFITMLEDFI